tara:strand:- start:721 stop:909 length:189 start_codon:yes stop_codon:yes gene_type:complete
MSTKQLTSAFMAKRHLDAALQQISHLDVMALGLSEADRKIIHMHTAEAFNRLQKVRRRLEQR